MSEILIGLEFIRPNPWQPREGQDAGEIEKLAASIKSDGLMQPPTARRMADGTYQLAFGHRRYEAFLTLARSSTSSNWSSMPLVVRNLTDEEMFRYAVAENLRRQDLTPIEEARSMVRYRDDFGKTSAEIGELFGISDATVRGKIRLLKLPPVVQDLIRRRQITEGAARALINMYELPEAELQAAEDVEDGGIKPSEILEIAASGVAPQQVANAVEQLVQRIRPSAQQLDLLNGPVEDTVSTETLAPEDQVDEEEEIVDEIHEEVLAESMPDDETDTDPEPVMVHADPAPARAAMPEQSEAAQPRTAPKPAPAAPPEPVKPPTWAESTIVLTITLWPDDGSNEGRLMAIGGRVNQGTPVIRYTRMGEFDLGAGMAGLLADINQSYQEANHD